MENLKYFDFKPLFFQPNIKPVWKHIRG